MKLKIIVGLLMVVALFYLLPEPRQQQTKSSPPQSSPPISETARYNSNFIIRNAQIYDGYKLYQHSDLLIENNRVAEIAANIVNSHDYRELDGSGKTIIPGMIDAHSHAWGKALEQALNFAVTTELDMFTMPEFSQSQKAIRDDINNVVQADLFSATILATAPNGHGTEYGLQIPVLSSEYDVEPFVLERINDGADYIKAVYQAKKSGKQYYPSISKAILKKLIEVSHQHEKMLVVHVDNFYSAQQAIMLGADGIVHSFIDEVVDKEFLDLMVKNKAFIIPTLSVIAASVGGDSEKLLDSAELKDYLAIEQRQQLKAKFPSSKHKQKSIDNALTSVNLLAKAGVVILAGSDAPNPGTSHGVSLHQELALLVKAGLSAEQALHSATGAARKVFPIGLRGTLKVGAPASLVLIDGDPLANITDTRRIEIIWKNGVQFTRHLFKDEIKAHQPIQNGVINDFEKNYQQTAIGYGIEPTTDQYIGGNSQVNLSLTKDSPSDNTSLLVSGEIGSASSITWSGFAFFPGKSYIEGVNLSKIKQLSFDAKAGDNIKAITVMIFEQGSFLPRSQTIQVSKRWHSFQLPLAQFSGVNLTSITNISLVAMDKQGKFSFYIDNLKFD